MKKTFVLAVAACSLVFGSCEYGLNEFFHRVDEANDRSPRVVSLANSSDPAVHSDVKVPDVATTAGDGKFSVFIFSDIHFGRNANGKSQRFEDEFYEYFNRNLLAVQKYNGSEYPLRFAICSGDCVEHGFAGEYEEYKNFTTKFQGMTKQSVLEARIADPEDELYGKSAGGITLPDDGLVTYAIAGNHDLFNSGWSQWRTYCYPYISSYYFTTTVGSDSITWYFLDSGNGTLGYRQLTDFTNNVKNNGNVKFVTSHYPVYAGGVFYFTMQNVTERDSLISLFAQNQVKLTLEGHYHSGGAYDFGSYYHEELVKSFVDYTTFGIIYVDLKNKTMQIKQVDYLNDGDLSD